MVFNGVKMNSTVTKVDKPITQVSLYQYGSAQVRIFYAIVLS